MERLTERDENGNAYWIEGDCQCYIDNESNIYGGAIDKLAEYEDLEEQGLLLRLPCKYNEHLYWIGKGCMKEVWFKGIRCDKGYKPQIIARFIDGNLNPKEEPITTLENIGKTVFLTRTEAEEALRRMEGERE